MSAGLVVGGIELEVLRRGAGRPILLLHGCRTSIRGRRFSICSAGTRRSSRRRIPASAIRRGPADFDTVYDLVHLYLEVLESLPTRR